ncbi:hypothetical protein DFO68_10153 [Halomonas ventosae]|uniref:Uncharacterized protein n=1 Tax=Halomonas ventosae TaxID=229007 RepID=A0A4R6I5C8_9GAMM|nr:hypothetical protein DFO68_10153 [Halomonas ventosae]
MNRVRGGLFQRCKLQCRLREYRQHEDRQRGGASPMSVMTENRWEAGKQ